ncbi:hypothetical protein ACFP1Z_18790 [Streptomyces gamaensis]|uniref:Uncharacterized protein n=1 Tax=Streptomyces gamaensis TaxID=1763542 RepID=A0ABW0Z6M0_9ACTN
MATALATGWAVLPASAHPGERSRALVACAGSAVVRFEPGLTLRTRHSHISGWAGYTCTGTDPRITWAKSVIKGGGEAGCVSIDATAVELVTWNTGEHSKVLYRTRHLVQAAGGEVVSLVEGTVVEGKYEGKSVGSPGAQLTLDPLGCLTDKGVEVINGPTTLVIT